MVVDIEIPEGYELVDEVKHKLRFPGFPRQKKTVKQEKGIWSVRKLQSIILPGFICGLQGICVMRRSSISH